ncbi:MAG: cache domain-containing protein [SAR324 cluster bacterium]|nr:cache domain-containing protein [SAR324 cluster bacterium]MBF0350467.1 cache domain-containing protein [SAR324 cluster bacterium]
MFKKRFIKYVLAGFCLFPAYAFANSYEALETMLDKKMRTLDRIHLRYANELLTVRNDSGFEEYFEYENDPPKRKQALASIQKLSLYTHSRFNMDEMCLISRPVTLPDGKVITPEIMRISGNKIATNDELSLEEGDNPFYEPSFKLKDQEVRIQSAYISHDSHRWVVAYSTPVVLSNGSIPAFLHYERYLGEYIDQLLTFLENKRLIVMDDTGLVLADSVKTISLQLKHDLSESAQEDPKQYFSPIYSEFIKWKSAILAGKKLKEQIPLDNKQCLFVSAPHHQLKISIILVSCP